VAVPSRPPSAYILIVPATVAVPLIDSCPSVTGPDMVRPELLLTPLMVTVFDATLSVFPDAVALAVMDVPEVSESPVIVHTPVLDVVVVPSTVTPL
jgi:hypothetical protein